MDWAGEAVYAKYKKEGANSFSGYEYRSILLRPGLHHTVVETTDGAYYTFPEIPHLREQTFRNAWVLIRNNRPDVLVV